MKFLSEKIDKFCLTHPRFGIRNLMRYIVALSAVIMVLNWLDTGYAVLNTLALIPSRVMQGEVWRLVTWVFIGNGGKSFTDLIFGAISLFFYHFIGTTLERDWGAGRFTIFYVSGVILSALYSMLTGLIPSAMYLNLSLFFAFATLYPDMRILVLYIFPVKIKWVAWLNAAFFAYTLVTWIRDGAYAYAFLPIVAVANILLICGIPGIRFARARAKSNVINFKSEARRATRQAAEGGYRHKCEVCGHTDVTHPDLQFRYCSRCEGFHCYCEEHIEAHQHQK